MNIPAGSAFIEVWLHPASLRTFSSSGSAAGFCKPISGHVRLMLDLNKFSITPASDTSPYFNIELHCMRSGGCTPTITEYNERSGER